MPQSWKSNTSRIVGQRIGIASPSSHLHGDQLRSVQHDVIPVGPFLGVVHCLLVHASGKFHTRNEFIGGVNTGFYTVVIRT